MSGGARHPEHTGSVSVYIYISIGILNDDFIAQRGQKPLESSAV